MATSFSGGGSRREPLTMGKQLVNCITCGCESSAPFVVIYKAGREPTPSLESGTQMYKKKIYLGQWLYMTNIYSSQCNLTGQIEWLIPLFTTE
jgi:hypothetical protein